MTVAKIGIIEGTVATAIVNGAGTGNAFTAGRISRIIDGAVGILKGITSCFHTRVPADAGG